MNVPDALADLVDLSPGLEAAVAFAGSGRVAGSTLPDERRAAALADAARRLLDEASALRAGPQAEEVAAVTRAGALAVAREGDLAVAAVAEPGLPVRLALHDLRACARALDRERLGRAAG